MSEVLRFRRIKSQGEEKGRKFCSFTKVRFGAKFINSRTNKDKSKMKTKKDDRYINFILRIQDLTFFSIPSNLAHKLACFLTDPQLNLSAESRPSEKNFTDLKKGEEEEEEQEQESF